MTERENTIDRAKWRGHVFHCICVWGCVYVFVCMDMYVHVSCSVWTMVYMWQNVSILPLCGSYFVLIEKRFQQLKIEPMLWQTKTTILFWLQFKGHSRWLTLNMPSLHMYVKIEIRATRTRRIVMLRRF